MLWAESSSAELALFNRIHSYARIPMDNPQRAFFFDSCDGIKHPVNRQGY
jgi:hypothetical protein